MLRIVATEFYLMASRAKDRDLDDYLYLYIKKGKVAKDNRKEDD